jgi:aconitase A
VTDYYDKAGVTEPLEKLGFYLAGYGCTTCIGNSGPLNGPIAEAIEENKLVVAAALSGNRNFEGRINQFTRFNYLMSPPLVVAYALAGRMDIDLLTEPLGIGTDGPVFLRDIWPSPKEVADTILTSVKSEMFTRQYANVFEGDERWKSLDVPTGDLYTWSDSSTYVKNPPFFQGMTAQPPGVQPITGARAVIAESFERIHRSNLVGMGVLPLEFADGATRQSLGLTGFETYDIEGMDDSMPPRARLKVRAKDASGKEKSFDVISRIDTPEEATYYKHGGILQYVLRQLAR